MSCVFCVKLILRKSAKSEKAKPEIHYQINPSSQFDYGNRTRLADTDMNIKFPCTGELRGLLHFEKRYFYFGCMLNTILSVNKF